LGFESLDWEGTLSTTPCNCNLKTLKTVKKKVGLFIKEEKEAVQIIIMMLNKARRAINLRPEGATAQGGEEGGRRHLGELVSPRENFSTDDRSKGWADTNLKALIKRRGHKAGGGKEKKKSEKLDEQRGS